MKINPVWVFLHPIWLDSCEISLRLCFCFCLITAVGVQMTLEVIESKFWAIAAQVRQQKPQTSEHSNLLV